MEGTTSLPWAYVWMRVAVAQTMFFLKFSLFGYALSEGKPHFKFSNCGLGQLNLVKLLRPFKPRSSLLHDLLAAFFPQLPFSPLCLAFCFLMQKNKAMCHHPSRKRIADRALYLSIEGPSTLPIAPLSPSWSPWAPSQVQRRGKKQNARIKEQLSIGESIWFLLTHCSFQLRRRFLSLQQLTRCRQAHM